MREISKIKKLVKMVMGIVFVISLALLGKFDKNSVYSSSYRLVLVFFWMSGIFRFCDSEANLRNEIFDYIKDFLVAIMVIPLWYMISGELDNGLYEPLTVLIHFIVLMAIVFITNRSIKLSGTVSQYTHAIIPILAIVINYLGIPLGASILIAVILPEPINYFYYKNTIKSRVN